MSLRSRLNDGAASPLRADSGSVGLRTEARFGLRTGRVFVWCADFACDRFRVVDIRLGGASRLHWLRPEAGLGLCGEILDESCGLADASAGLRRPLA